MAPERRNQILLGALAVVLLVVTYRNWPRTSSAASPASNESRPAGGATQRATVQAIETPDVRLEALEAERAEPGSIQRDLFRFKPKPPPPPPRVDTPVTPVEGVAAVPMGPPPPPPVPPITLKFIGIIDRAGQKIAVLSDSTGHVDYGVEGAIIGGRYRVLKIGVESIEMAHLDGRGRQTLRLTGS